MKRVLSAAAVIGGVFFASGAALAQTVSEEEIRCFTEGGEEVCKIAQEKKFSLTNLSNDSARTPQHPATISRPAPATTSRRPGSAYTPARPTAGAGTRSTARMTVARPGTLDMSMSFLLGSAELTPSARSQADVFAKVLKDTPGTARFMIEGHTDTVGTPEQNDKLSRARAESVVTYLVNKGVPATRLQAVGYGFKRPRQGLSASDPSNRRVEIVRQ